MKQWRLLIFALLALLALVACGSESGAVLGVAAAEEADEANDFVPQLDPQRPYPAPDLALVGNTGRPQFLNSYADW
ncbi:MAG: hypothetical protein H6651_20700 [Ardenticatenales bacterium]|nr:hypothetical protein [Ardenticatenales bacterium]